MTSRFAVVVERARMLCLVACVLTATAVRAAPGIAVLPTTGAAAADARKSLDGALRRALGGEGELALLSAAETAEHVATMADLGSTCAAADVSCLQKLGILAGVDLVLVSEARGKRTLNVRLSLLDVGQGTLVRSVEGTLAATDTADVAALVHRVVSGEDVDALTTPVKAAPPRTVERAVVDTNGAVDESALTELQVAGVAVAATGGAVAGLGVLGALGCEAVFWTGSGPAETRRDVVAPAGAALWVLGIVGAVAAGVGGGLYWYGRPAPATSLSD